MDSLVAGFNSGAGGGTDMNGRSKFTSGMANDNFYEFPALLEPKHTRFDKAKAQALRGMSSGPLLHYPRLPVQKSFSKVANRFPGKLYLYVDYILISKHFQVIIPNLTRTTSKRRVRRMKLGLNRP